MSRRIRIGLLLALLAPVSAAMAQESGNIDARADQVLRQMGDYLAGVPHFRVHAEVSDDGVIDTGQLVVFGRTLDMVVRRPDRLWADMSGDLGHKRLLYDGRAARLLDFTSGTVAEVAVPATIEETINLLIDRLGVVVPLSELAFDDPYAALTENVETGTYVGIRTVDGVEYHHLAFTQATIDWEVWIENGARPLPRKLVIRYKDEPGSPQFTALLSDWDLADTSPDALFSSETPLDFTAIEFIVVGGDEQ